MSYAAKMRISWAMYFLAALLVCLGATIVHAQELPRLYDLHQSQYGRVADPYQGIFNFDGINCCTGHDCLAAADPKDFEPIQNGYRLRSTGEVVNMKTTGFSPDANWHVCRKSDARKTIRCLLVPPGGT